MIIVFTLNTLVEDQASFYDYKIDTGLLKFIKSLAAKNLLVIYTDLDGLEDMGKVKLHEELKKWLERQDLFGCRVWCANKDNIQDSFEDYLKVQIKYGGVSWFCTEQEGQHLRKKLDGHKIALCELGTY